MNIVKNRGICGTSLTTNDETLFYFRFLKSDILFIIIYSS